MGHKSRSMDSWAELFTYCPTTGVLRWRSDRPSEHFKTKASEAAWRKKSAGNPAGGKDSEGYIKVDVYGKRIPAHRICWEMVCGPVPGGMVIDHINGNPSDNRLCNLRMATTAQNIRNSKLNKRSTTGLKGVTQKGSKWRAQIMVNRERIVLGSFETPESAHAAYCQAALERFGEFARNR